MKPAFALMLGALLTAAAPASALPPQQPPTGPMELVLLTPAGGTQHSLLDLKSISRASGSGQMWGLVIFPQDRPADGMNVAAIWMLDHFDCAARTYATRFVAFLASDGRILKAENMAGKPQSLGVQNSISEFKHDVVCSGKQPEPKRARFSTLSAAILYVRAAQPQ